MSDTTNAGGTPGTDPNAGAGAGPASSAPAARGPIAKGRDDEIQLAIDHLSDVESFLDEALDIAVGAAEAEGSSLLQKPGLLTSALAWVPDFAKAGVSQFLAATVNKQIVSLGGQLDSSAKTGLAIAMGRVRATITGLQS